MTALPSPQQASLFRDQGIAAAADHAERHEHGWQASALEFVRQYAANHPDPFLAEEAREYAELRGLSDPPDGRAWGAVMQAARRAGVVVSCGFALARSSNHSPKMLWKAVRR